MWPNSQLIQVVPKWWWNLELIQMIPPVVKVMGLIYGSIVHLSWGISQIDFEPLCCTEENISVELQILDQIHPKFFILNFSYIKLLLHTLYIRLFIAHGCVGGSFWWGYFRRTKRNVWLALERANLGDHFKRQIGQEKFKIWQNLLSSF